MRGVAYFFPSLLKEGLYGDLLSYLNHRRYTGPRSLNCAHMAG